MRTSHLLILMEEAGLSPEALAKRLGVSNMSVRRWAKQGPSKALPELYAQAAENCVYQLMIEDRLEMSSRSARWAMRQSRHLPFHAAISRLGLGQGLAGVVAGQGDGFMRVLCQIGSKAAHRKEVDASGERMAWFKRLGRQWAAPIATLQGVLKSKRANAADKLVGYGALFYLVCPFDLIPDSIPAFGLVDDFAVLTLAAAYLTKKYGTWTRTGAAPR